MAIVTKPLVLDETVREFNNNLTSILNNITTASTKAAEASASASAASTSAASANAASTSAIQALSSATLINNSGNADTISAKNAADIININNELHNIDVENITFGNHGLQLFDIEKANTHGYYNSSGAFVSRADMTGGYIYVKGLEKVVSKGDIYSAFLDANKNFISSQTPLTGNNAITVPSNACYFFVSVATTSLQNVIINSGSSVKSKSAEYKRAINITNYKYENMLQKAIVCGKNLFNKNDTTANKRYHYANGNYVDDNDGYYASSFIKCNSSTAYGINVVAHICYWNKDKEYISGIVASGSFQTFTTPSECEYITISTQNINSCMFSKGSTQIPYEDYYEYLKFGAGTGQDSGEKKPYQGGYIYKQFNVPKTKELTSATNTNTAYLKLPLSYSATGVPTKLCIITHGASMGISEDGVNGWTYNAYYNNIVTALNNNGYAVIDSNGYNDTVSAGHEHWGCPQALAGYYKAYKYFTDNYNLEKSVYLYGFSMGGLTALNLSVHHSIPIKCVMLASPVISLYDQCVSGTATTVNSDFLAAYGMTSYSADKCRGYDRYLDIVTLGSTTRVFKMLPPIYCAYGLSDVNISNTKIDEYFTALHNSNYDATIKGYTGGHEISYGGNQSVIDDMIKFFNYY